jgi:proline racemase
MVNTKGQTLLVGQDKITALGYDDANRKHQIVLVVEKPDGTVHYRYESGHVEMMYQCRLCREYGKALFNVPLFSTQEDLNLHVQRLHGGYPDSGRT